MIIIILTKYFINKKWKLYHKELIAIAVDDNVFGRILQMKIIILLIISYYEHKISWKLL